MSFFNQKEDVLDIKLTDRGRLLLSQGKFKPHFYSFHDNDILYDTAYAAFTQSSNIAAKRIEDETPRLKSLYSISPTAPGTVRLVDGVPQRGIDPVEKENMKLGLNPIGTSLANTNETPYFECTFLKGNISGSAEYLNITSSMTGERFTTLVNPIINLYDMTYESRPVTTDALDTTRPTEEIIPTTPDFPISSPRLADGRFIKVERDYFIILLDEENTENEFDNFSIAIFEVDETTDDTTKLFFLPQEGKVDEDGFYDPNIDDEVPLVTDDYVDYYLEISADHEIDSAQLCSLVSTDEFDGKFVDPLLDCEDIRTRRANIRREIDVPPEEGTEC